MGMAHLCKCGHLASEHSTTTRKGVPMRHYCEFAECPCELYTFEKTCASNFRNNRPMNDPEPEPMYSLNLEDLEPLQAFKKFKKREVFLSDCGTDGVIRPFFKDGIPKFNNGEYI